MNEIIPGVWHWTTPNSNIGNTLVSSYWLDEPAVFIDPLLPADAGAAWFESRPLPPQAIVLSNRHHYRDSGQIHERFGCQVHVPAAGLHEFSDRDHVVGYEPGDELPGGLVAFVVGSLSPDEHGLLLAPAAAIWLGDTIVRSMTDPESRIGWVPDSLMDDPQATKAGLLAAFTRVLEQYDFEHLMLAHGLPLVGDGRDQLEQLVRDGGRSSEDAF
ncbi:MAG TPA: hypothetical protein VHU61_16255 [Solirubrobacteraceae bacterium]|jgi:hypothetical protein|nr:hypothetical protein [Solirubrobacteraceae bacterium]